MVLAVRKRWDSPHCPSSRQRGKSRQFGHHHIRRTDIKASSPFHGKRCRVGRGLHPDDHRFSAHIPPRFHLAFIVDCQYSCHGVPPVVSIFLPPVPGLFVPRCTRINYSLALLPSTYEARPGAKRNKVAQPNSQLSTVFSFWINASPSVPGLSGLL